MPKKVTLQERLLREYLKVSKQAQRDPRTVYDMAKRIRWERLRSILQKRYGPELLW